MQVAEELAEVVSRLLPGNGCAGGGQLAMSGRAAACGQRALGL